MSERAPVKDWKTDWDHLDSDWRNNPYPIWDKLRKECPIAHTERFEGAYLPTRYEDVKAISYDTNHFSSRRVVVRDYHVDVTIPAPPITSDPPWHKPEKRVLLPFFSMQEIKKLEPKARAVCNELIDGFIDDGQCDAAQQYSRHIPVRVIAHMLGVDENDGDLFIRWIHEILELGVRDYDVFLQGMTEMTAYFQVEIDKRKDDPRDDLISIMMQARCEGEPWTPERVLGALRLLMIAGIDTTWSAIGSSLWHLATHPQDRQRLLDEPELMPTAVEEMLRAYSPVTMAREVVEDTEISGCPIKAGNMVLLSFPAANRDPEMFEDADKVVIDRQPNRHSAFGLGIHRCVGSNLARMEMTVAIEEWLKRIPHFSLEGEVTWSEGTVRGPRSLPFKLT
ncbi:MAG: cytochrome P450 [Chloroflexi bacterium]|nr:cytochrome P450 [Chloroflexota bacterium]